MSGRTIWAVERWQDDGTWYACAFRWTEFDAINACRHYDKEYEHLVLRVVEYGPKGEDRENVCGWEQDDDGFWHSECGRLWEFNEGDPKENLWVFCHGCGKPVKAFPYEEEDACTECGLRLKGWQDAGTW